MWYSKLVKKFHFAVQICNSRCFRDVFGELPLQTKTSLGSRQDLPFPGPYLNWFQSWEICLNFATDNTVFLVKRKGL